MQIKYKDFTIEFQEKINFNLLSYKWQPGPTFMLMQTEDEDCLVIAYAWEDFRRKLFNYQEIAFSIENLDTPEKKKEAYNIICNVYGKLYEEYLKDPKQELDMKEFLKNILGDEPFQIDKTKKLN